MQSLRGGLARRPFGSGQSFQKRAQLVGVCAKPTAAVDFRPLSPAELMQKAAALKVEYTKLQYFKRTRGKLQNPETLQEQADDSAAPKGHEFKHVRRQLAQVLTVLREKQIADGINRKDARRLEKAAAVGAGFGRF